MNLALELQSVVPDDEPLPDSQQLHDWVQRALAHGGHHDPLEMVIRIVDITEITNLNHTYRHKNRPTNVLAFPFEAPDDIPCRHLGDLVICASVVAEEARQQNKPLMGHWAHMVVHGTLHLLGYDHLNDEEANIMESQEIQILEQCGYSDPYQETANREPS